MIRTAKNKTLSKDFDFNENHLALLNYMKKRKNKKFFEKLKNQ